MAEPTIFVIFGATGDVVAKKVIPALWHLREKGTLPELFRVIGVSRRDVPDTEFQNHVRATIAAHAEISPDEPKLVAFSELFSIEKGNDGETVDYKALAATLGRVDGEWRVCANKLFYLAIPPDAYESTLKELSASGLTEECADETGWTRILVEKPIGSDAATATKIDELLGSLFEEKQIYRIEHYLAKEMLRNILTFRFTNNLFEMSWDKRTIESIHIRLWETLGVEKRGSFYDDVGALRDVGQNHLLQMMALVTMDRPSSFSADAIREKRAELLESLVPPTPEVVEDHTFRGQYEGYREIKGVSPDSETETFFKIRTSLAHPRWGGVPIIMESGKRMHERAKDIVVTFKHPEPCLCPPDSEHFKNRVIFSIEPKEGIMIEFWSKKPGHGYEIEKRSFDFLLRGEGEKRSQYVEEYEKLILDGINGDQTLFVNTEELKAMWRFIDPIVDSWKTGAVPLTPYKPDTDGAEDTSSYLD
jgi:glucose-6-phosphate 1-dehydrogenase